MTDTPEEARYRAEVRARLEKEKKDKESFDRLKRIDAEEKAKVNKKPLGEQLVGLGEKTLKAAWAGWAGTSKKKRE